MASLPPLPGPPVGQMPNTSKGVFGGAFVHALSQHIGELLQHRRQQADQREATLNATYRALAASGDPESIPIGLAGLIGLSQGDKAARSGNIEKLVASPLYQQLVGVSGKILEGPGGAAPAGAEQPSAAMAPPTIPKGTAAAGADQGAGIPFGASQMGVTAPAGPMTAPPSPPPAVSPEDFRFEANQMGSRAPFTPESEAGYLAPPAAAPPPATPTQGAPDYEQAIAALSQSLKIPAVRFDAERRGRAQKAIDLLQYHKLAGKPFEEAWQVVIEETAPTAAAAGRVAKQQEGALQRTQMTTEATVQRALIQAGAKPRRLQIVKNQPRAGGPSQIMFVNPETGRTEPLLTSEGQPMTDSPEFRQQISRDAQGNEYVNWVLPGGGGGAAATAAPTGGGGLSAPPSGTGPTPTRAALTFPKEQQLADDLRKEVEPYVKQGDSIGKILSLKGDESGAAQMATIFSFIQNLDQSVVRPSEVETLKEAQALVDRWQTLVKRGLGGSDIVVSPGLIDRLRNVAQNQYSSTAERQAQVYGKYLEKAEKEKLDGKFIVGSIHPSMQAALQQRAQAGLLSKAEQRLLELMAKFQ